MSNNLKDPVVAYEADTNVQAHLVRNMLVESGIAAFVIEDVSYVGTCELGTLPGINKPQVWVERADLEAAHELTTEFDDNNQHRTEEALDTDFCFHCGEPVASGQVVCAACGQTIADQKDKESKSSNPYLDRSLEESDDEEVGSLERYRRWKRPLAFLLLLPFLFGFGLLIIGAIMTLFDLVRNISRGFP